MDRRNNDRGPARLRLEGSRPLGMKSVSAVAPLGGRLALVVDDDAGILLVDAKGGACPVVVHEGKPMAVGVFTLPDLDRVASIPLDGAVAGWMRDASDVTVCPVTGHTTTPLHRLDSPVEVYYRPAMMASRTAASGAPATGSTPPPATRSPSRS